MAFDGHKEIYDKIFCHTWHLPDISVPTIRQFIRLITSSESPISSADLRDVQVRAYSVDPLINRAISFTTYRANTVQAVINVWGTNLHYVSRCRHSRTGGVPTVSLNEIVNDSQRVMSDKDVGLEGDEGSQVRPLMRSCTKATWSLCVFRHLAGSTNCRYAACRIKLGNDWSIGVCFNDYIAHWKIALAW